MFFSFQRLIPQISESQRGRSPGASAGDLCLAVSCQGHWSACIFWMVGNPAPWQGFSFQRSLPFAEDVCISPCWLWGEPITGGYLFIFVRGTDANGGRPKEFEGRSRHSVPLPGVASRRLAACHRVISSSHAAPNPEIHWRSLGGGNPLVRSCWPPKTLGNQVVGGGLCCGLHTMAV